MRGLDKFKEYMKDYSSDYIIIGGTAVVMMLEESNLPVRATKDIDMIVVCQPTTKYFMKRFWGFIKDGKYKLYRSKDGKSNPNFYRFIQPDDKDFPAQIELFSMIPEYVKIPEDVHVVHIPMDGYTSSFSAIILDKPFYDFAIGHRTIVDGVSILNAEALVVLKALAFMNNLKLKKEGKAVDRKNIDKHKRDIYRLAYTFGDADTFDVDDQIKNLLRNFIAEVEKDPVDGRNMFRGQGIPPMSTSEFTSILKNVFRL